MAILVPIKGNGDTLTNVIYSSFRLTRFKNSSYTYI